MEITGLEATVIGALFLAQLAVFGWALKTIIRLTQLVAVLELRVAAQSERIQDVEGGFEAASKVIQTLAIEQAVTRAELDTRLQVVEAA